MPSLTVKIEWNEPEDEHWLNADNVAICLHAYCKNTKFKVQEVDPSQTVITQTAETVTGTLIGATIGSIGGG